MKKVITGYLLTLFVFLMLLPAAHADSDARVVPPDDIRPHDYILMPQALPCISHTFQDHPEVLKFTEEQKKAIEEVSKSAEKEVLKTKAKEIRAIEYQLKKKFFSGKASEKELRPLLRKIADLRIEQTLRFFAVQNRIINMLSKEQYRKVMRIIAK
jgi:Spy/CpxP family protein refolding chaperone